MHTHVVTKSTDLKYKTLYSYACLPVVLYYNLTKLWFVLNTKHLQQKSNTYSKIKTNPLKTVQLSFVFIENIHTTLQILGRIGIQIEKDQLQFKLVTPVSHFGTRNRRFNLYESFVLRLIVALFHSLAF